jgi:hypothetical protein
MIEKLKQVRSCATWPAISRCWGCARSWCTTGDGLPPGNHALGDRSDALRCLRPAAGVHHVHAVEPIPRGAGSAARIREESAEPARPVHPHGNGGASSSAADWFRADRRPPRRSDRRRAPRPRWRAPPRRPAPQFHDRFQRRVWRHAAILHGVSQRRPGAAQRLHASGDDQRAHHRESPGAVPGNYAVLQPGVRTHRWETR